MDKTSEQHEVSPRIRGLFVLLVSFLVPASAFAHAEEPNSENVFATGDGWVLRANVGIVQSSNPTELICEESFLGGEGWILGALGESEWITWGETSVMRTEDGCNFDRVMPLTRVPSAATVHQPSGNAAFIMNTLGTDESGLWVSTDRGQSFENIHNFEPNQTTDVRFLDGTTVLVSGYDRENSGAGLGWTIDIETVEVTALQMPADTTYPYVLAASNGYALILARRGDQIVFWGPLDDLDQNEYVASTWPSWGRLSEDGQTAWVSGMLAGKSVAVGTLDDAGTATWKSVGEQTTAGCVEPVGEDLFVCGLARFDDFDILRVTPAGDVEGVLDFRDFAGVRSDCSADSEVGSVCPTVWNELAPYFGIDPSDGADAGGTPDAGNTADMDPSEDNPDNVPPAGDEPDGGCCATTPGASNSGAIGLLLLAIVVGRRGSRALTQNSRRC